MSATSRHDVRACPDCRLTFPSPQALKRHGALDHRPASDGAWLTARIVDPQHADAESPWDGNDLADGDAGTVLVAGTPPAPAVRPGVTTDPAQVPWLLLAALMGLVALTVRAELLFALALLMLAWSCAPRRQRQVHPSRSDGQRGETHAPED